MNLERLCTVVRTAATYSIIDISIAILINSHTAYRQYETDSDSGQVNNYKNLAVIIILYNIHLDRNV
jgi:hypothetical protein